MTATATEEKKSALSKEPEDPVKKKYDLGLALSGGGYRASLFHLGVLWRLNELGLLRKLDRITSVSGGSIVAAYLGSRWSDLKFEPGKDGKNGVATNFREVIVEPMRDMFATTIDVPTIGRGLLNPVGSTRLRIDGKKLVGGLVDIAGEAVEQIGGRTANRVATAFARPFGAVFGTGIDVTANAWERLNRFPTPTELLVKEYDRLLFHGKTLQDLPEPKPGQNPEFLLYATNMQSGASVRLSKRKLEDYKVGKIPNPEIPLAKAVAASSGFPPFYCPVEIKVPLDQWRKGSKSKLFDRSNLRERMDLGDGAVYDNLGLTTHEFNTETILVSDAGDSLDVVDALSFEWLGQILRTLLVSMDQTNKLRVKALRKEFYHSKRKGAYWGIGEKISYLGWGKKGETAENKKSLVDLGKEPELLKDNDKTHALGEMRTRLNRFTDEEQENLINWGYALTDARMRRWVIKGEGRKGKLPFRSRLK